MELERATIFAELTRRNALRREAGLPLLDLRREFDHEVALARWDEYQAVCDAHADLRAAIQAEVVDELRRKTGRDHRLSAGGRWLIAARTRERFEAALARMGFRRPPLPGKNLTIYGGG
ncbi:MAG: hypothetical protein ICV73_26520 [Acetobacteraceae bacterium]|nr:hypothetical protein [Acetobacteraceae bacterium]